MKERGKGSVAKRGLGRDKGKSELMLAKGRVEKEEKRVGEGAY